MVGGYGQRTLRKITGALTVNDLRLFAGDGAANGMVNAPGSGAAEGLCDNFVFGGRAGEVPVALI